jgi:hypothetical protein
LLQQSGISVSFAVDKKESETTKKKKKRDRIALFVGMAMDVIHYHLPIISSFLIG